MNRLIKFRCWHKEQGKMLFQEQMLDSICRFHREGGGHNDVPLLRFILLVPQQDIYVLQQFAGLLDKNGKEIYEGDILEDTNTHNGFFVVKYGFFHRGGDLFDSVGWYCDWVGCSDNVSTLSKQMQKWEVVGNIFENPKLIK